MTTFTVDNVFRDYVTLGDPSSGEHHPVKSEIRGVLKSIAGGTSAVGDFRGAWDSGTAYISTDLVEEGGSIWYALADNTNVTPTEGATWTLFLPGVTAADGSITLAKFASSRIIGVTGADFSMVSDLGTTNTDNNAALQAAIDYCVTNRQTLWLFGNYRVIGEIEITGPVSIFLADGAELNFSSLGANKAAFTLTHTTGRVVFDGSGTISGPTVAAYVGGEVGIKCIGTDTDMRRSGLTVRGIEITDFGSDGIYCQFVNGIVIDRCRLHGIGYAAAQFLSCDDGEFIHNHVYTIGPGASSNMYGLAITHDSVGYHLDADAGTKLAANPFSRGWHVAFNEVEDIAWEGLDCHGAYEVQVVHNRIYATKYGIALPSSSGDAAAYAGYQNICAHNVIDGRNKDGTASGRENTGYGVNLNGGSTVNHLRIVCGGNIIRYKGISNNASSGAIQALYCANAVIAHNVIDMWGGASVYAAASGGKIADNHFGACAAVSSDNACVRENVGTTKRLSVTGNVHDPGAGNAATYGLRQQGTATFTLTSAGNDFRAAGTAISVDGGVTFDGQ